MNECAQFRGEFTGWDKEKRQCLLRKLLDTIDEFVGPMTGSRITLHSGRKFPETYMQCAVESLFSCNIIFPQGVSVVFDFQQEISIKRGEKRLCRSLMFNENIKTVTSGRSGEILPLQAADLIAYEVSHWDPYKEHGICRYPMKHLLKKHEFNVLLY